MVLSTDAAWVVRLHILMTSEDATHIAGKLGCSIDCVQCWEYLQCNQDAVVCVSQLFESQAINGILDFNPLSERGPPPTNQARGSRKFEVIIVAVPP